MTINTQPIVSSRIELDSGEFVLSVSSRNGARIQIPIAFMDEAQIAYLMLGAKRLFEGLELVALPEREPSQQQRAARETEC